MAQKMAQISVNRIIPVKKHLITLLDTSSYSCNFLYQYIGMDNYVDIYFSDESGTNFHIDPKNTTHIICDRSGVYDLSFGNTERSYVTLYVDTEALCAGYTNFKSVSIQQNQYISFGNAIWGVGISTPSKQCCLTITPSSNPSSISCS